MINKTRKILKKMRKENKITIQQYKTFKGQIVNGNEEGCIKGLKRLKLI